MTDDCHATGFIGKTGRGVHEHCAVMDKVDVFGANMEGHGAEVAKTMCFYNQNDLREKSATVIQPY